jgi:predicted anti-sigma-YlaC factor YlaD
MITGAKGESVKHEITCREYQSWLVDSLSEAFLDSRADEVRAHAAQCQECRRTSTEIRASWRIFSNFPPLEPPRTVREKTRRAIIALAAEERASAASRQWLTASQSPLAVISGLLVAAATVALLSGLIWGSSLPRGHLFFCAAIYTGLLVGAFSWIYSASTVNGIHLDAAARVGVVALAITVAATTACPELHALAWWDHSYFGSVLTDLLGAGGSSVVFGFGYGLLPGFLAALFGGQLLADRPVANGFVAVAVVFLLATPVIYLQSSEFTSGVIASWLAGTAIGTLCGVFGAIRVRQRVALVGAV